MPNNAAIVAAGGSPLAVGQRRPVSPHGLSAVRARVLVPVCGYVYLFPIDLALPAIESVPDVSGSRGM